MSGPSSWDFLLILPLLLCTPLQWTLNLPSAKNHLSIGPTAKTLSYYITYQTHFISPDSVNSYLSGIINQLEPYYPDICKQQGSSQADLEGSLENVLQGCLPQETFVSLWFGNCASMVSWVNFIWWPPFWGATQHQVCRSPSAGWIGWEW